MIARNFKDILFLIESPNTKIVMIVLPALNLAENKTYSYLLRFFKI